MFKKYHLGSQSQPQEKHFLTPNVVTGLILSV